MDDGSAEVAVAKHVLLTSKANLKLAQAKEGCKQIRTLMHSTEKPYLRLLKAVRVAENVEKLLAE